MIDILNAIINSLGTILGALIALLPNSPFEFSLNVENQFLKALNWIFPVAGAITHLSAYIFAVAIYYAIRIPLKWIKAAGN